ncbi:hypothetical protein M8J77_002455 [Diaphorina citri]|nr:hypothetical protein M8J77_002455 [Diaphorina citri]
MDLHRKSLTVNEILIALEEDECQNDIETTIITIFPPDNCNDPLRTIGDHPYNLYNDNFFGGLPLLEHLNEKSIFATCTMRENRLKGCPLEENAKFKKQERGSFDYRSDEKKRITVCKWKDNSVVTIATNSSSAINPEKQTRCGQCHQECTSRCKKCDIGLHVKCFELYHTRN